MRIIIQPIRFYAKEDILVLHELIEALRFVENSPNISGEGRKVVRNELRAIGRDVGSHIKNDMDKARILKLLKE
jgi:hypothetical protein